MKKWVLALTLVIASVFGLQSAAQAEVWSGIRTISDCSYNACLSVDYEVTLDEGVGMKLVKVQIRATGGLGDVGHHLWCWNQNAVVKWSKTTGIDLNSGSDSVVFTPDDSWPGASEIVCRYSFDAEYLSGEVPDQFDKITALHG